MQVGSSELYIENQSSFFYISICFVIIISSHEHAYTTTITFIFIGHIQISKESGSVLHA
jgi:hypothetical protein